MTNVYKTFQSYKAALNKILDIPSSNYRGHTKNEDGTFSSILVKSGFTHPNHQKSTLTKSEYTMTLSDDELARHLKVYGQGQPILIINHQPKSAFAKKYINYGFYKFDSLDIKTNTIKLKYIQH